jgi:GT2 family glycosyltransferase
VFVDDDVYFEPGWASAMLDAFAQHPDADAVGGRIVPLFEAGRPKWLVDSLLPVYGQTNCGSTMRWLVYPEQPFGGNMAFRREVFEKVGLFDPRLGRDGKRLLSNEEIDFFFRFHQQGLRVLYEPNALLHHRIPADRTKPEWVCSRYYWQGVSDIVFRQITSPRSRWRLAFEGIGEWLREANTIRGGHISPRRIHWHIKGLSVEQRANRSERLGTCHQKLREALRLVPTKKQNS